LQLQNAVASARRITDPQKVTTGRVHNVFGSDFSANLGAARQASRGRTFWRNVTVALVMEA
jgi:hypothetical protein